jgi:hypothetical protein
MLLSGLWNRIIIVFCLEVTVSNRRLIEALSHGALTNPTVGPEQSHLHKRATPKAKAGCAVDPDGLLPGSQARRDGHAVTGMTAGMNMNKLGHGIILAFFGAACWLVWALLQLPLMVRVHGVAPQLPAFSRFCMGVGPIIVIGLALFATAYCVWVWFRKTENRASWVGFLATAKGSLFLITLPIVVAIYLPLVSALQFLPAK